MQTIYEKMGGTYRQVGDYLLPNIEAPKVHRLAFGVSDACSIFVLTKGCCTPPC